MERNIYQTLKEIKEQKSTILTKDVKFLGTIQMTEKSKTGDVGIVKDIYVVIDETSNGGDIQKFYDENGLLVAGRSIDGRLFPGPEFANEDIGFLKEIDSLELENGLNLEELDQKLDEVSKELGISKSEILSMTEVELDQIVKEKGDVGLVMEDDEKAADVDKDELKKENEEALKGINSRQEINLDEKVDDRYTLADILGVQSGATLLAVDSDKIQNNENSTRFSCIIKLPDGTLKKADMLTQVGGKDSDKSVYETNYDGSEVEKQSVKSSYKINSPIIKNGIITIRYGDMGRLKVSYGKTDPTSHRDAITEELRGREVFYRTERDIRDEFSTKKRYL